MSKSIHKSILKKNSRNLEIHNDVRIDNYYWLNDRENQEVIDYLNAENNYTKADDETYRSVSEKIF